jgi:hypothetical protein
VDLLQVLSGKLPYHHLPKDAEVLINLYYGIHPPRPADLADEHWALISRCWAEDPCTRPDIKEVSECVQHHYRALSATPEDLVVPSARTSVELHTVGDDARTPPSILALVFAFVNKLLLHITG